MSILHAFADGARRVARAPLILAGVYLMTLLVSVPLVLTIHRAIASDLGDSAIADRVADGTSYDWWQEYAERADGLAATFQPTIIGLAAPLDNLSALLDGGPRTVGAAGAIVTYIALWAFLIGGILDRYARRRATRAEGFFPACGVYFVRFLRLAIIAGGAYYLLFAYVRHWLLDDLYGALTRDVAVERTGFFIRLTLYLCFGALLLVVNLLLDYAKIRAVVEDRRSMVGACLAGWRFVKRRPLTTAALYLLNGLVFLTLLALYGLLVPGTAGGTLAAWGAIVVGQLYIVARLAVKLLFYASQTAYFQQELAHAEYTAAPIPAWPDSPAAEAIGSGNP